MWYMKLAHAESLPGSRYEMCFANFAANEILAIKNPGCLPASRG